MTPIIRAGWKFSRKPLSFLVASVQNITGESLRAGESDRTTNRQKWVGANSVLERTRNIVSLRAHQLWGFPTDHRVCVRFDWTRMYSVRFMGFDTCDLFSIWRIVHTLAGNKEHIYVCMFAKLFDLCLWSQNSSSCGFLPVALFNSPPPRFSLLLLIVPSHLPCSFFVGQAAGKHLCIH